MAKWRNKVMLRKFVGLKVEWKDKYRKADGEDALGRLIVHPQYRIHYFLLFILLLQ